MKKLVLILSSLLFVLVACTNENADNVSKKDATPTTPLVTVSGATLAVDVTPIMNKYNCYTCHGTSNANSIGGGIALQPYSNLKMWAQNGKIYGSVAHLSGFDRMPKGGGKLTDLELAKIKFWIDNGAKDD